MHLCRCLQYDYQALTPVNNRFTRGATAKCVTFRCTHAAVFNVIAKLYLESSISLIVNDRLTTSIDVVINNDKTNSCLGTLPDIGF